MPFFIAQVAIGAVICGSVKETRAMYGDFVVMIEVAAFITIIGVFPAAAGGATASAFGVRPNPARKSTLSLAISCWAWRLATSGAAPVVSLTISSILRPATASPFAFM